MIRVASANGGNGVRRMRSIDCSLESPKEVLAEVQRVLDFLEEMAEQAGSAGYDVLAVPEECLGLSRWEAAHPLALADVLPEAVDGMIDRLGSAAVRHWMYLICSNDTIDTGGEIRNAAMLLDRKGQEIGRYHKVNLPVHEQYKRAGEGFPVFDTPDLGGVGMLI